MAKNPYFSDKVRSEQNLYEDLVIESLKVYGQDVYYLPRDLVREDKIFGDEVPAKFGSSHKIEMYIENSEGFEGEGDLFTRFGVEIRDEATFVVSRRRWTQQVGRMDNQVTSVRPLEGDLIYLPLSKSLFQIQHVEHEQPFYQLSNLPVFKLRATLFEYNDEDLDTGIEEIDDIEDDNAYTTILTLNTAGLYTGNLGGNQTVQQTLSDGAVMTGEVAVWDDVNDQIHLIHIGSSDGTYRQFNTAGSITFVNRPFGLADSSFPLSGSVEEEFKNAPNTQNAEFSTDIIDFVDFTEDNPFGDIS
jgi:hypothetical protein